MLLAKQRSLAVGYENYGGKTCIKAHGKYPKDAANLFILSVAVQMHQKYKKFFCKN